MEESPLPPQPPQAGDMRTGNERTGNERTGNVQPEQSPHGLSDILMQAFEQACDQHDVEVAHHLLDALDLLAARIPPKTQRAIIAAVDRKVVTNVAAHERMWRLRNPGHGKNRIR